MKKIIKLTFLLAFFGLSNITIAQSGIVCDSSISYNIGDISGTVYSDADTAYWLKFKVPVDSVTTIFDFVTADSSVLLSILEIKLYTGACSSLTLIFDSTIFCCNSLINLSFYNLDTSLIYHFYHLEFIQSIGDTSRFLILSGESPGTWPNSCPNSCDNLVSNGNFETPPFPGFSIGAFGEYTQLNDSYVNCWGQAFVSPDFEFIGGTHYAYMYARYGGFEDAKGILQSLTPNIVHAGKSYILQYDYNHS